MIVKYSGLVFDIGGVKNYLSLSDQSQEKVLSSNNPIRQIGMVHVDEKLHVLSGENHLLRVKKDRLLPIMFVVHPGLSDEQKQSLVAALHPNLNLPKEDSVETNPTVIPVSQKEFRQWGSKHPPTAVDGGIPGLRCVFCKNTRELKKFLSKDLPKIQVSQLPDKLIDASKAAILGRKHAVEKARQQPIVEMHTPQVDLWCGDFVQRGAEIPDNSVDVIFTDPPYLRKYLHLWDEVAEFAARVLKPGGLALMYSGKYFLPQVMESLGNHLDYIWMAGIEHTGGSGPCWGVNIRCCYKPILIYGKPPIQKTWKPFDDLFSGGREKDLHDWQQSAGEVEYYLRSLGRKGTLVDPMMGAGSTIIGALSLKQFDRIIGIEIEPATFNSAKQRIEESSSAFETESNAEDNSACE